MSHLIHALDVKREMTEAGVLCPQEQSHLLCEGYIRAGLSKAFKSGGSLNQEADRALWVQLEKWNSVSPINARFIHQSVLTRGNLLIGTMATEGTIPCSNNFTLKSEDGVNVADMPSFPVLVKYLIAELEKGHE